MRFYCDSCWETKYSVAQRHKMWWKKVKGNEPNSDKLKVRWSAFNDHTAWTLGVDQAGEHIVCCGSRGCEGEEPVAEGGVAEAVEPGADG